MTPEEAAHWDRIEQDFPHPRSKYWVVDEETKAWAEKIVAEDFMPRLARAIAQMEFEKIATDGFEADYDK